MPVEIINAEEVKQYFKDFPEITFKQARKVYAKAVLAADKEVKLNATTKLNTRTGALKRSIGTEITGTTIGTLRAILFSGRSKPLVYAPIHEFGGTVKAKNAYSKVPGGPYLNIPIADNLTAAGVMRMSARAVFSQGGKLFKSKKGKWVITYDGKLMFCLVKEVTIEPQLGMRDAMEGQIPFVLAGLKGAIGEEDV